jgi:hypothetical protein
VTRCRLVTYVATLTILAIVVVQWAVNIPAQVGYEYQTYFGEGIIASIMRMFVDGTWNWDISIEPYMTMIYPPVYYGLSIATLKLGVSNELIAGRIISLLSVLGSMIMLALIVKHITKSWLLATIAGLLPIASPVIRDTALIVNVDTTAVFFELTGLYVVVKHKERGLMWSVPFFVIAFFSKQTAVAGAVATLAWLFIYHRKKVLPYCLALAIPVGIGLGVGTIATGGGLFQHLFTYNITSPMFWSADIMLINLLVVIAPVIVLLGIAVFYAQGKLKAREFELPVLFFLSTTVIYLFTQAREGSYIVYGLAFLFSTCLLATLWLKDFPHQFKSNTVVVNTAIAVMLIITIARYGQSVIIPRPDLQYTLESMYIEQIIADTNKPVLAENAWIAVKAGKQVYIEPFVFSNLSELGLWDKSRYLEDIKNQRLDYIILRAPVSSVGDTRTGTVGRLGNEHLTLIQDSGIEKYYKLTFLSSRQYAWYSYAVYEPKEKP